ncbi:unnamed protein product [Caenorhabditis bovis]|uniref:Major facilitator superfamily (MFS) profile domain-containing protein n=1 Tax=Caenorhabditis bovis TaxID=2654633 RepID=A0A8S1ESZ6_9PELO|nr:unnamed protein product [Caenorhabditis bovis]
MADDSDKCTTSIANRKPSWPPIRLALVAILVSFGSSFNFGFQLLITNPAQGAFLKWSFIVAIFFLGSVIGAFLIRVISERFGRKNGLILSISLQFTSCVMAIVSFFIVNHYMYTFSRLLMGTGITTSMGIAAIFVTEASPLHCRGITSLINGVLLQFSLSVGAILAMPQLLGTPSLWYLLYVFEMIIITIVLILLPFIHDSPGHLASNSKPHKTAHSIEFYHSISKAHAEDEASRLMDTHIMLPGTSKKSLMSVWRDPFVRRGTFLGMVVTFSMAMSGITVINAFAFEILLNTGLEKYEASIANAFVCLFSLAGILVSTRIIDHHGRRPLLLSTFAALAVVNVIIVGLMYAHEYTETHLVGYLLVASICLFNFVFAMGPGPVSLFISGELVPHSYRSASSTWSNAIMASSRFIILSIYLPVKNMSSEYIAYAIFFIAPMIAAVALLYFILPESKNKSPEEIQAVYEKKQTITK